MKIKTSKKETLFILLCLLGAGEQLFGMMSRGPVGRRLIQCARNTCHWRGMGTSVSGLGSLSDSQKQSPKNILSFSPRHLPNWFTQFVSQDSVEQRKMFWKLMGLMVQGFWIYYFYMNNTMTDNELVEKCNARFVNSDDLALNKFIEGLKRENTDVDFDDIEFWLGSLYCGKKSKVMIDQKDVFYRSINFFRWLVKNKWFRSIIRKYCSQLDEKSKNKMLVPLLHEIGHCYYDHSCKKGYAFYLSNALWLMLTLKKTSSPTSCFGFALFTQFLLFSYFRYQEKQADEFANSRCIKKEAFDEAIKTFEKQDSEFGLSQDDWLYRLKSLWLDPVHPCVKNRVNLMKEARNKLGEKN